MVGQRWGGGLSFWAGVTFVVKKGPRAVHKINEERHA